MAKPAEQDVKAMADALANARRQFATGKQLAGDKQAPLTPREQQMLLKREAKDGARGDVRDAGRAGTGGRTDALADPLHHEREQHDGNGQNYAMAGQGATPPVPMPQMPAPHVDPAAFAQLLADLWTRENGKGAREVSVQFGKDAWPATGARLVRNAAGTLDIALLVGDHGRSYGDRLPGLEAQLADAGVGVGALAIEDDA